VGELCSFDAFLAKYELTDPALQQLALIVRRADTSRLGLAPRPAGLYAISLGLSRCFADDHEMLRHGMVTYDTLYAWCLECSEGREETHNLATRRMTGGFDFSRRGAVPVPVRGARGAGR
jgi:hypothetical protein